MKINKTRKPAVFMDMDGTLAEWRPIQIPLQMPSDKINKHIENILYKEGYYKNLYPYKNMINMVKTLVKEGKVDVYILSCVLPKRPEYPNSEPLKDKNDWLDEQFGDLIPNSHRIFVPDGEPKHKHIPFKLQDGDMLLDDYTNNLHSWVNYENANLKAIKVLNPINDTKGTFKGPRISILDKPEHIINRIYIHGDVIKVAKPTIKEAIKTQNDKLTKLDSLENLINKIISNKNLIQDNEIRKECLSLKDFVNDLKQEFSELENPEPDILVDVDLNQGFRSEHFFDDLHEY